MRIAVIGAGYVGLVTAVCLAERGHEVVVAEKSLERRSAINAARAPFFEPFLDDLLAQVLRSGKLAVVPRIDEAVSNAQVTFVAVGTPFDGKTIDLTQVSAAATEIGKALQKRDDYHVVVVKSTCVPGTTDTLVKEKIEEHSGLQAGEFGLCMNPEFLREGSAVEDFRNPDRIVIGCLDQRSGEVLSKVYAGFDCTFLHMTLRNAELTKYASNSLLSLLVSFSNELATLCEALPDTDIDVIMDGLHLDKRLSPVVDGRLVSPPILSYLRAGCGFGGSCLPKDVNALRGFARSLGVATPMLDATIAVNEGRADRVISILNSALGDLKNREIAILGLAFKPNTDDVRESPALRIIAKLSQNDCRMRAYDPMVSASSLNFDGQAVASCDSAEAALLGADAVVIVTAWPQFAELPWKALVTRMRRPFVIDGRRLLAKMKLPPNVVYLPIGIQLSNDFSDSTVQLTKLGSDA